MDHSAIEWTDATWNPIRGCTRVSEGCRNCYAERIAARFSGPGLAYEGLARATSAGPRWTGVVDLVEEHLEDPIRWARPRRIFVNSMSDLFHERLDDWQIDRIFAVMATAWWHTFQVLTKRAERMQAYVSGALSRVSGVFADKLKVSTPVQLQWPLPNVWLGTSVEDQSAADGRIPRLLRTPAAVRFISAEPLLGPVDLAPWLAQGPVVGARAEVTTRTLRALQEVARAAHRYMGHPKLDWVIAGGESGPGARPMHPAWPRALRDACLVAGVPFFFKQWGEYAPTLGLGSRSATVLLGPSGKVFRKGVVEPGSLGMARVGKQRAGRMLDGRTWDEMPEPQPVQTEGAMP